MVREVVTGDGVCDTAVNLFKGIFDILPFEWGGKGSNSLSVWAFNWKRWKAEKPMWESATYSAAEEVKKGVSEMVAACLVG